VDNCTRFPLTGIFCPDRGDHLGEKLIDLLRGAADELPGVQRRGQIDIGKGRIGGEPLHQVVPPALLLDRDGRRPTVPADPLVQVLPVAAGAGGRHEEVFG